MTGASRTERAWLLAAVGLQLALATWVLSTRHYWPRYDSGVYVSAATALSRGVGLRDITSPVTRPAESWAYVPTWIRRSPVKMDRPDWPFFGHYPPLLPLVLSPLVTLGGGRFAALQLVPLAGGMCALVLAYRWREALFPGPWRLTLLVSAGSMLTLYATRVQSEAVHTALALAGLRALARAGDDTARLGRWATLAALALLLGTAVHVKMVFFALGAAAWLVVGPRAPLRRRLLVGTAFAAVTILPAVAFTFGASWANPAGGANGAPSFTLGHNPYYWSKGGDPSAPLVDRSNAVPVVGGRVATAGRLLWNGLSTGSRYVQPDAAALVLLVVAAALAGPWWRHRRGLLALPTVTYLSAVVLSPWAESRMAVPVLPLVAHALAVAVASVPSRLGVRSDRATRQTLVAAGGLILLVQASHWRALTPPLDEYALEYWEHASDLARARVAAEIPAERVVIVPGDSAAFAVVSGHATQSTSPIEWKESNPRVFLQNGGAPAILGPLLPRERLDGAVAVGGELAILGGPRTRQIVLFGDQGLVVEWVRLPPPPPGTTPFEPIVPGRIHPRWMRLSPADREALARAAIPAPAP